MEEKNNPNHRKRGSLRGGPQTEWGKAQSKHNARQHGALANIVDPEEEVEAQALYRSFRRKLNPQDAVDRQLIQEMVLNRLQLGRLNRYEWAETKKAEISMRNEPWEARLQEAGHIWDRVEEMRSGVPVKDWKSLPLTDRLSLLEDLTKMVEKSGLEQTPFLRLIDLIYGSEKSPFVKYMLLQYTLWKDAQGKATQEGKSKDLSGLEDTTKKIRLLLDLELDFLRSMILLEKFKPDFSDWELAPPPETVENRVQKYRDVLDRRFERLLRQYWSLRELESLIKDGDAKSMSTTTHNVLHAIER